MKPEPLKLKDIEDIILNEQLGDLTFHAMMDKISERIRSACEFYLRYRNNPRDLFTKHRGFNQYFDLYLTLNHNTKYGFWLKELFLSKSIRKKSMALDMYNRWLFTLAFKDVLEGDGNVFENAYLIEDGVKKEWREKQKRWKETFFKSIELLKGDDQ